ncbi:hypothetical protein DFJ74DRAFT_775597 [Hyaloraphidium curvatum]|nr:hypothetical protein DFJ74DRAFT_775597 [Hyaloraphidium curvatum]
MPRAQKDATVTAVTAPALPPAVLARVAEFLLRRKRQLLKFILLSKVHYRAGLPVLLRHLDLRFARDPRGGKEMLAAFLKDGLRTDKFRHVRSIDTGMQEFRGYAGVPSAQLSRLLSKCSQLRSLKTAAKSRAQLPALANALAGSHPSLVELDLDLQTSAAEALEFCGPLPRRPWIIRIHTPELVLANIRTWAPGIAELHLLDDIGRVEDPLAWKPALRVLRTLRADPVVFGQLDEAGIPLHKLALDKLLALPSDDDGTGLLPAIGILPTPPKAVHIRGVPSRFLARIADLPHPLPRLVVCATRGTLDPEAMPALRAALSAGKVLRLDLSIPSSFPASEHAFWASVCGAPGDAWGRSAHEFPGSDWCGVTGVGRPGARAVADGCVALYGVPVHGAMLEACIFVGSQRPPWAPTSVTSAMTSFWSKRLPEIAKLVHRRRPTDSVALAEPVRAAREFFLGLDTRGADGATRPLTWQLRAARSALLMHEEDTERVLQFLAALDAAIASHHFRNEFAASEARRELEAARILLPRSRDPQAEWDRIQKEMLETCEICLERARIKHGLVCAKGHFACRDCTERNLKVLAEPEERARLEEDGHLLRCYKPQCLAPPFSLKELAGIVSEECFKAYMAAMKLKVESRIIAEQRRAYQAELERERRILAEGKVASFHAGCIAEEILTLTCPKCRLAYHIADGGCAALKCSSCKAAICFWCGAYCGHDAHRHAMRGEIRERLRVIPGKLQIDADLFQ